MEKLIIDFDATSLSNSACRRKFYLTVIGSIKDNKSEGGYRDLMDPTAVYGIALHKFVDLMYKTKGNFQLARKGAERVFNMKKAIAKDKHKHLEDFTHLVGVCYNYWEEYLTKESSFQLLTAPIKCWNCDGSGQIGGHGAGVPICPICNGKHIIEGPTTEMTFRIKFLETNKCIFNMCGTLDAIGKFVNGIFAIKDIKTTSQWDKKTYLEDYSLSKQLRVYALALKLYSRQFPDSTLGKIGATKFGAFIDGVFLKPKINEVTFQKSEVFTYTDEDLNAFENNIMEFLWSIANEIEDGTTGTKDGIMNGACKMFFNHCQFWNVCACDNKGVEAILLSRFNRKIYDPLHF